MANRYWVGGSGNWSDTARWSTSSGGTGGASVPGTADYAIIDSNSGSSFTITLTANTAVGYLDMQPGGTMTFALSTYDLTIGQTGIYGALIATAGVSWTGSGAIIPSTYGLYVNCVNAVPNFWTSSSSGSFVQLQRPLVVAGAFNFRAGFLYFNTSSITCDNFYSTTSTAKYISKSTGGGTIYLTGSNKDVWNMASATNINSSNGYTPVVLSGSASSGTRTVRNISAYFSFAVTAGTDTVYTTNATTGAFYCYSLDLTGFTGTFGVAGLPNTTYIYGTTCTLPSGITYANSGTLTLNPGASSTSCILTTGGQTLNMSLEFQNSTIYLGSNVTLGSGGSTSVTQGAYLVLQGYQLTTNNFSITGNYSRTIEFGPGSTGTISVGGNWAGPTQGSMGSSTNSGKILMTSAFSKTYYAGYVSGGYVPFSNITLRNTGAGALTINPYGGSKVLLGAIENTYYPAAISFTAGGTFEVSSFSLDGNSTYYTTLQSSSSGSAWYLNAGASTVRFNRVQLKDSYGITSGGATYYANNSQSLGNNTNWSFVSPGSFIAFF